MKIRIPEPQFFCEICDGDDVSHSILQDQVICNTCIRSKKLWECPSCEKSFAKGAIHKCSHIQLITQDRLDFLLDLQPIEAAPKGNLIPMSDGNTIHYIPPETADYLRIIGAQNAPLRTFTKTKGKKKKATVYITRQAIQTGAIFKEVGVIYDAHPDLFFGQVSYFIKPEWHESYELALAYAEKYRKEQIKRLQNKIRNMKRHIFREI